MAEGIDRDGGCEEIVLNESDLSFESVAEDEDSSETGLVVQNVSQHPSSGTGYFSLFTATLKSLLNEEHLQSTSRGHNVIALGTFVVEQGDCKASVDIAMQLCSQVNNLLEGSKKNRRLPTAIIGKVWSNFHKLRFNDHIQDLWGKYLIAICTSAALRREAKLLFQLLLDRILKRLIAAEASDCSAATRPEQHVAPTLREQNGDVASTVADIACENISGLLLAIFSAAAKKLRGRPGFEARIRPLLFCSCDHVMCA